MSVNGELMGSRGGNLKSLQRRYNVDVSGSADPEEDAIDWVLANAPGTLHGLVMNDIAIQESGEIEDQYEVTAQYGQLDATEPPASGSLEFRFNFQAQGFHAYYSLETIASYPAPELAFGAPDFKRALNVIFEGGVPRSEGFQIEPPSETFALSYYPVNAVVTSGYQLIVADLCGKVNNATFRGFPAGSLMLVRCSGGVRTNEDWSIEFGFGYVPNQTSIPVGDDITVTSKDGLDLLWAFYSTQDDATAKHLVKRPAAAYVERVWYRGDFSTLSLPA